MTTEVTTQNDSKKKVRKASNDSKLPQENLIDDCFYVKQSRWKTWSSYDKENKLLVTSLSEEELIKVTRWYLKKLQEGFSEDDKTFNGTVGGKL